MNLIVERGSRAAAIIPIPSCLPLSPMIHGVSRAGVAVQIRSSAISRDLLYRDTKTVTTQVSLKVYLSIFHYFNINHIPRMRTHNNLSSLAEELTNDRVLPPILIHFIHSLSSRESFCFTISEFISNLHISYLNIYICISDTQISDSQISDHSVSDCAKHDGNSLYSSCDLITEAFRSLYI